MQQKFLVLGVPVFTRKLPSGDMAVWHPFNSDVQAVIEPICRGRGYWQPDFTNWIVKAPHAASVLRELATVGRSV